jgi:hypothetical protein
MSNKKSKSDLQSSYQAMVDNVEEFVIKEGKTLQQAFHAAEDKLNDAKDLSKEKIQQASKELQSNLRLLSETAEGVGEAYKERIKFDLAYVNNSIWSKLQSIAKSNTVDLIEFSRTLQDRAQQALTESHLAIHQEHNEWRSEHALWQDEVDYWTKENAQALKKLTEIEATIKQQSTLLDKHAKAIQTHIKKTEKHEESMKNVEQDYSSEAFKAKDEKEVAKHQKERQMHVQQSENHYILKARHFKIMAMINMLHKELQSPNTRD